MVAQIKNDPTKVKNVEYKEEVKEEDSSVIKHLCDSVNKSIDIKNLRNHQKTP